MGKIIILRTALPTDEIEQVEKTVRALDYICSGFDEDLFEPYKIRDYLVQKHLHENEIHAVLDRNLVSSLTRAARNGEILSDDEKQAITLLNFLRLAEVELEPGISLAEYVDTFHSPLPTEELDLLRKIDDIPNENLHDLALGRTKKILIAESAYKKPTTVRFTLAKAEHLHQWNLHYGYALKIHLLHHEAHSKVRFLAEYAKWMWRDFAFGGVAFAFASTFVSGKFGRMIKAINSLNDEKVLKGIRNAAWDMTIVHYWTNRCVRAATGDPLYVFCTADKGLQKVARHVISQDGRSISEQLNALLGGTASMSDVASIAELFQELQNDSENPDRAVHGYRQTQSFFDPYIRSLETEVLSQLQRRRNMELPRDQLHSVERPPH